MSREDFLRLFPTEEACRAYLKERLYPDGSDCPGCGRPTRFHKIRGRSAFSCQFCGTHVHPTVGTILEKSPIGLQAWFWAVYLLSSTRFTISYRQLERELGVSYGTARRMFEKIRTALEDVPLGPQPTIPSRAWQSARRRS